MTRTIQSRHPAKCSLCLQIIPAGATILWNPARPKGERSRHFPTCPPPNCTYAVQSVLWPQNTPAEVEQADATQATASEINARVLERLVEDAARRALAQEGERVKADLAQLHATVLQEITDALRTLAQAVPLRLEVQTARTPEPTLTGICHHKLPELLYYASRGEHVYLFGPPGSGKSFAAQQAAQAMSREFGYVSLNPMSMESRLIGYNTATGEYIETLLRRLYQHGGLFCIDEADNANESLLASLNSLLANGLGAFPDGMVERHAEFVMVATGNTAGRGGDRQFPNRRRFDVAFADRFVFVYWPYDLAMERALTLQISPTALPWFEWVVSAREYLSRKQIPDVAITPRASFRGAQFLLDGRAVEQIAEAVCFRGMEPGMVAALLDQCPLPRMEARARA